MKHRSTLYKIMQLLVVVAIIFFSGLIVQTAHAACTIPVHGMVSWWPGEGNANDIVIVNNNKGTLMNGTTFTTGVVGKAFWFDNTNDFVSIANSNSIPFGSSPRTVEMWVYIRSDSWVSDANTIFEYGIVSTRRGFGIDMAPYPTMQFYAWNENLFIDTGLPIEGWAHVAVTYDGNLTLKAFINGILKGTKTLGGVLNTGVSTINIGRSVGLSSGAYFNGLIDEVTIYDIVLTDAEIMDIYAAGSAGKCRCNGLGANIIGTQGDDVLDGTTGNDVIMGLGGNDIINGLAGNDVICAGAGNDIVNGGPGNDRVFGEAGNDTLNGDEGSDTLIGGIGDDTLDGGLDNTCDGSLGNDTAVNCATIINVP